MISIVPAGQPRNDPAFEALDLGASNISVRASWRVADHPVAEDAPISDGVQRQLTEITIDARAEGDTQAVLAYLRRTAPGPYDLFWDADVARQLPGDEARNFVLVEKVDDWDRRTDVGLRLRFKERRSVRARRATLAAIEPAPRAAATLTRTEQAGAVTPTEQGAPSSDSVLRALGRFAAGAGS